MTMNLCREFIFLEQRQLNPARVAARIAKRRAKNSKEEKKNKTVGSFLIMRVRGCRG